ncbi:MAG: hypothetical protein E6K96_04505 [Thaumarchaeota archaeon]|nr:MAG: hypothetical protein E6K96_04505 [Nitrososphaerota archaeon]
MLSTSKGERRRHRAVVEVYSSLVIIAMVVSLSYLVYSQAPRPTNSGNLVFLNDVRHIFASPPLVLVAVNASAPDTVVELDIDEASSSAGILALVGSSYTSVKSLCAEDATTFFSVYAAASGELIIKADGESWVDGYAVNSLWVGAGWHEVVLGGARSCEIILPGGGALTSPGSGVNPIPVIGRLESRSFALYLPFAGSRHQLQILFTGGVDSLEIQ